MELPKEYILPDFNIRTLHIYDLLKHTANADFMAVKEFQDISPVALELNAGVFTKSSSLSDFPRVAVSQVGSNLVTSCSCNSVEDKLCIHQAEIIHCLLEEKDYRIFFDVYLRHKTLLPYAKSYGLEEEGNLDIYFRLDYLNGRLQVSPKIKELLQVDEHILKRDLLPRRTSIIKNLATQDSNKKQILVIGKHRYYNQLNFQLMEADTTQTGKLKNPINSIDVMKLLWKAEQASEIKFYTAITSFNNQYGETDPAEAEALRHIVQNPLNLEVYLHDRAIAESISAKSLVLVNLNTLQAEIQLHVFRKEPFYEITGELLFRDITLPFSQVVIRNEYFVYYRNTYYLITDPDMLRVIQFFKSNNEILLVHSSRYEVFMQSILIQLEQRVQINYSYIRQATPTEIADKDYTTEKLIYLHQEGNYISITPVMKYGNVEIPVYSRKQLLDTDQNGNEFKIERDHNAEIRLTRVIMEQHSDFREQIEEQEYFYLHKDKFLDDEWFLNAFETWRNEDINILGFNNIKNNKLNAHRAKITIEVTSGIDWFNAQLKVGFGHKKATLKQVNKAIRNKSKFVQLDDGTLGILPDEWMHKIARYFQAGDIDEELLKIPKVSYTEIQDLFEKEVLSEEVQAEVASYTHSFSANAEIPEVAVPETLNAELRAYQREGLNWLNFLDSHNFGGCLADDMGLGKTVQIIAFILSQREKHDHTTNLVVLPTSLLFNWQEELAKFAPSVKVLTHYGTDRQKSTADFQKYEVVLTTYGMLLSDITFLKKFRFNYIFLDESQTIKNPNSERYKAARLLQSRNRIALTGTPVENNTFDLYGQLSFACPGLLGSKQYFKDIYAIPIDKFEYSKRSIELQKKIKPFILRRTKKQVATELPEKTEMLIYCEMNTEQRRIYDLYEKEVRDFISATDEDEIHNKSMHVLTGLMRLRQICNSPVLLKDGHSGDHAVKIEILTEQIENKSKEHKILVFSQFVEMLDLIKAKLDEKSIRYEYLTGQTRNRGAKVQHFQNNEEVRVFLISLKAGGTGLNLTEADYVYLVDPWWNPAVENQAIDRSYRIGQTKNVVAVRMICSGTIEEKMMNLQKKKKKLAQDLITTETSFFSSLSKDDLLSIL